MAKKLSIELQKTGIRFILSNHKKNKVDILEAFETDFEIREEEVQEDKKESKFKLKKDKKTKEDKKEKSKKDKDKKPKESFFSRFKKKKKDDEVAKLDSEIEDETLEDTEEFEEIEEIIPNHEEILEEEDTVTDEEVTEYQENLDAEGEDSSSALSAEEIIDKAVLKIAHVIKIRKWDNLKKTLLYNLDDIDHEVLDLPLVPNDEMEELVLRKLVADGKIENEEETVAFETIGVSDDKGLHSVYVQRIPQALLEKLTPLKLKGIDFEIFAANRKQSVFANESENIAFVEFKKTHTVFSIYYKEKLALYRKVNIGRDDVTKEISTILGISETEANKVQLKYGFVDMHKGSALMDQGELRGLDIAEAYTNVLRKLERKLFQYIDYFQFKHVGENLKTVYFKGMFSDISQIKDYVASTYHVENVFEYNVAEGLGVDALEDPNIFNSAWSLLLGTVESNSGIKDIGKSFKLPFKVKKNPILIAISVIYFMILAAYFSTYKLQEVEQQKQLKAIQTALDDISQEINEYKGVQNKISRVQKNIDYLSKITGKSTIFNNFLSDISYIIGSQIYIEEIVYSGNQVTITGKAISNTGYSEVLINQLVRDMEEITESVKLIRTSKFSSNNSTNDFLIEVVLEGGE